MVQKNQELKEVKIGMIIMIVDLLYSYRPS